MKKLTTLLICLSMIAFSFGQKAKLFKVENSKSPYHYWCYEPENYNSQQEGAWPVIVFLHGRSLSGTDLEIVRSYGLIHEVVKGRSFPAIIIAPQVKKGESWDPAKVVACIRELEKTHRVDTTRISITGMSLGGYGTLHTAGKYPELFCAAAAFCGGGSAKDACRLSTIPVWVAHGKRDRAVPFGESYEIVERIKSCDEKNVKFTVFESHDHGALERMFRTTELFDFLLNNKKGKPTYFPPFNKKSLN
jgi:predicted peptidase